ncbi:MAG: ATP-binding cassette domain-containing protein [Gemmatimonadota bacterium]|nr:MAG: ATP-binding cassette domain-containing protein [Gemmatimonadota bacterium]
MITITNLSKHYGSLRAVDDITFEVKAGEILGFLGPNAAGKTTTMKIITCYMPPTSGTVEVGDMNVFDHSLEIRRMLGYMPEDNPLYHDMNTVDYLYFIAELRGIPPAERTQRLKNIIELCGVGTVLHQDIGELSKGFRQRVGLARAMVHDPEILVLDEPTVGLDPNQIVEIRNLIKELGKEKTVILSTHILPEVQATCDRVVIIHQGKLVADGTPEELQSSFQGQELVHLVLKAPEDDVPAALANLENVSKVEDKGVETGNLRRYAVESQRGTDIRESLFHLAVEKRWTIFEMHREQVSLENVFRELTKSE